MARKSLIQRSEINEVQKAHNCQANANHRLKRGDRRLRVYVDRTYDHYCSECAIKIVEADIAKLQDFLRQLRDIKHQ